MVLASRRAPRRRIAMVCVCAGLILSGAGALAGKGHRLGLTIALGQAQVLGVYVEFTHAPEGGARTVLRLPSG